MPQPQPNFLNLSTLLGIEQAAWDEMLWQLRCALRVCLPAVVVSFDAVNQLVTVQPAIQEAIKLNLIPTPTSLPQLPQLQVGMFRGGGFAITLPLQAGDEGWVIFNDFCINAWKKSGGTQNNQEERRRHDLSDGWFLPAGWSKPRNLSAYSTTGLQIRSDDGTTSVTVSDGSIVATPDSGTTEITLVPGVATLKAASIVFNGPVTFDDAVIFDNDVTVDGTITATGDVNAPDFNAGGGVSLTTHIHGGVQNGSGVTGGAFG